MLEQLSVYKFTCACVDQVTQANAEEFPNFVKKDWKMKQLYNKSMNG